MKIGTIALADQAVIRLEGHPRPAPTPRRGPFHEAVAERLRQA
jgi:hypothetical protein